MTFLEAAVEVLRRAGRPLPVREIAALAIRHNLLTHEGRDPEGTMKARLEAELARPPDLARVTAIRPDVFTLTEAAASVPSPPAAQAEPATPAASGRRRRKTRPLPVRVESGEEAAPASNGAAVVSVGPRPAPAASPDASISGAAPGEDARREGRRRRRGGRRSKGKGKVESTSTAVAPAAAVVAAQKAALPAHAGPGPAPPRPSAGPPPQTSSLADAAFRVLREHGDKRPVHYRQITDMALRRKLVPLDLVDPRRAMRLALLDDQRRRRARGLRPRFHGGEGGLFSLAGARLDGGLLEAEEALASSARRLAEATRRALLQGLRVLTLDGVEQLVRLALARRDGMEPAALERQTGFVVLRSGVDGSIIVVRLQVNEVDRATVRSFGAHCRERSMRGMLATVADVPPGLMAEGSAAGVQLLGGADLCDLLIEAGVGVVRTTVPVSYLDDDLLGGLSES